MHDVLVVTLSWILQSDYIFISTYSSNVTCTSSIEVFVRFIVVGFCVVKFHFWYTYTHKHGKYIGHVLFNDVLNTFYLRLYGHMVEDHS